MNLASLRDASVVADGVQAEKVGLLAEAENEKLRADGDADTARRAFAHGLVAVGGSAVDTKPEPPVLYVASGDGSSYSTSAVPDLYADAPDPVQGRAG